MDRLRDIALRLIIALNVIALVVSFVESFAGLFQWAGHHSLAGWESAIWPLMIDIIVLVGEAGLFVAHKDHWRVRDKIWLWFITLTALGVSMAANIGHVVSTDWLSHLTAALPPLALFFSMTVGFGVMKRVYLNKPSVPLTLTETLHTRSESPRTQFVRTSPERSHAASQPQFSPVAETVSQQPLTEPLTPPESPLGENLAPAIPESLEPTETFAGGDFRATKKSYTMPHDDRTGLKLPEQRVRDMFTLDPDIPVNAVAKALGVHWKTAEKYLNATKEARGLPA